MGLKIEKFKVGTGSNCYLVSDETYLDAIVIDPGFSDGEFDKINEFIHSESLSITYIIDTHGHPDHTSGNKLMKDATGAPVLIHKDDEVFLVHTNWPILISEEHPKIPCPKCGKIDYPTFAVQENNTIVQMGCKYCDFKIPFNASGYVDQHIDEEDIIKLGEYEFTVIYTPGHSPGGVCLYCETEKLLFSGDTLFNQGTGRVDNPFSDPEDLQKSLQKLWKLPEDTRVLPGHGPESTIGTEKSRNQ